MTVDRWFASDNNAAAHPAVMEAIVRANTGHAIGYGDDPLTSRAEATVAAMFGPGAVVRFVVNGTGANVYALACFAGAGDAIMCSDCAHILVDETGAPTAVTGAQLVPLGTVQGKVQASSLSNTIKQYDDMHKPRPAALSLSQPTELGTVYTKAELSALCHIAHGAGMAVHIDGARLSNAAVALGVDPAEAAGYVALQDASNTGVAGADVVCFGGTKNGLMFGEAVVFAPRADGSLPDTARLRKTRLQLSSKMRYIAAQFEVYVKDGVWKECASSANGQAGRLARGLSARGIRPEYPAETNGIFIRLPGLVAEELRTKRFFYDWEGGIVRWMASWDTRDEDVDGLLEDLDAALARHAGHPAQEKLTEASDSAIQKTEEMARGREFLKSNWHLLDGFKSPQEQGLEPPPFVRPVPSGTAIIELPDPATSELGERSFKDITSTRRSRRRYLAEAISLTELSFLLWSCAGVKTVRKENAFRTVPSGGCRHPLDLLIYARRVSGLQPGLYRYMATDRTLALLRRASIVKDADPSSMGFLDLDAELDSGLSGQLWNCAAMCMWTAVPYRTEWRYTLAAAKTILLDAGHACQALYGACEALGLGCCAQAAYDQELLDAALGLDGKEEFAVYAAALGKV